MYLSKILVRSSALYEVARKLHGPWLKDDLGYYIHCHFWERFGVEYGDKLSFSIIDSRPALIPVYVYSELPLPEGNSRPMPNSFETGSFFQFQTTVCATTRRGSKCAYPGERSVKPLEGQSRSDAFINWLTPRIKGASLIQASVVGYRQVPIIRRTQGETRIVRCVEYPAVSFTGVMRVTDPEAFNDMYSNGIGRHRIFGYGMLFLTPISLGSLLKD